MAECFILKSGVIPKIFVQFFQGGLWSFSFPGQFSPDKIGYSINITIPEQFPNLCGELSAFLVWQFQGIRDYFFHNIDILFCVCIVQNPFRTTKAQFADKFVNLGQMPFPPSALKIISDASSRFTHKRYSLSSSKKSSKLPHDPSRIGLTDLIFCHPHQIDWL